MFMCGSESHHTNEDDTTSAETHTPRNWRPVELKLDQGEYINLASDVAYPHASQ